LISNFEHTREVEFNDGEILKAYVTAWMAELVYQQLAQSRYSEMQH